MSKNNSKQNLVDTSLPSIKDAIQQQQQMMKEGNTHHYINVVQNSANLVVDKQSTLKMLQQVAESTRKTSTMSIQSKGGIITHLRTNPHSFGSIGANIKYDTTGIISEEDKQSTANVHKHVESFISKEKNVEEIHFLSLTLHKCSKGMLNRLEPFSPKGTLLNEGG